ncbi:hypothetical protein MBLNU459_g6220t1 [Dothideomycetes sp. NU459]
MVVEHATVHPFTLWPVVLALPAITLAVQIWLDAVSRHVTEPYLDEVFHVGQAQTYCAGNFHEWDPKITTPPGVYLLSYFASKLFGVCDLFALRALNLLLFPCIFALIALVGISRHAHVALNVCLFPPLFFFGALYYTDVASSLFVLIFYYHFLAIHSDTGPTLLESATSISLAVWSLLFRQTNIFWVGVFPLGILLVNKLGHRQVTSPVRKDHVEFQRDFHDVIQKSWANSIIYDAQLGEASMEDYVLTIISLILNAIKILTAPTRLLRAIRLFAPYMVVLAVFGAFVLWNGGVVLGDKSNHVATIHLAQLLYLWPYITFFSLPLTYPYFVQGLLAIFAAVYTGVEPLLVFSRGRLLPRGLVLLATASLALLIVHFNTIVHPFTLADNRHYTFYVFRLLLRRQEFKYLAVPAYMACAWTSIATLGAPVPAIAARTDKRNGTSVNASMEKKPQSQTVLSSTDVAEADSSSAHSLRLNDTVSGEACTVTFLLIWLGTSALQLVTAPLVEPRYFILPWIMWRLSVPLTPRKAANADKTAKQGGVASWMRALWYEYDTRLLLETGWFVAINAATGYIFLNWGFKWSQEPGKVQRFMW